MGGYSVIPINLTFQTITGQITQPYGYVVLPVSLVTSLFTVVIVGYKASGSVKTVVATDVINAGEYDILNFINSHSPLDGYFIIHEANNVNQTQIKNQLLAGFTLPF